MKSKYEVPFAPIERAMKQYTTSRVSADAVEILTQILITRAKKITLQAQELAHHAGRKTIRKDDINLIVSK
ncbi:MAG: histone family protein [Candidatus Woesearchaeota archaeon]